MLRVLPLLLLAVAAQAQSAWSDDVARVAVLDAIGVVEVTEAGSASRTVAVTCPEGATCRLVADAPAPSAAVALQMAAHGLVAPTTADARPRTHACDAAGPCELATGLPAGRTLVTLDLGARVDALAPAGAHPLHVHLWVLADPVPGGALTAPLRSHTLFTPTLR